MFVCSLNIIASTIIAKFVSGPANTIISFFVTIFSLALFSLNVILNPNGIMLNFFIFNPKDIPARAWLISCMNVKIMNIKYMFICFVIMKIIMKRIISMFMLICILITFFSFDIRQFFIFYYYYQPTFCIIF